MVPVCIGLVLLLWLLSASWGPGCHMEYARRAFERRAERLPASTVELLESETEAFFYGNVAADLITFKAFGGHQNHCHRWTIIQEMETGAESPAERAFVLGYLSHLAADTISHNHYVPYHMARYPGLKGLSHVYWEMRADRFVREEQWELVGRLKRASGMDVFERLVDVAVPRKALSMWTNRMLFRHVVLIGERDRWRRAIERLHASAAAPLEERFLDRFRDAAVERVLLALCPGGREALHHLDTTGKAAQSRARAARSRLLRRDRTSVRHEEVAERVAEPFLRGMESPPRGTGEPHWP